MPGVRETPRPGAVKRKRTFICCDPKQLSEKDIADLQLELVGYPLRFLHFKKEKRQKPNSSEMENASECKMREVRENTTQARTAALFVSFLSATSDATQVLLGIIIATSGANHVRQPILALIRRGESFPFIEGCYNPQIWELLVVSRYDTMAEAASLIKERYSRIAEYRRSHFDDDEMREKPPMIAHESTSPVVTDNMQPGQ